MYAKPGRKQRFGFYEVSSAAAVLIVASVLIIAGCGGPEEPAVVDEPTPVEETWVVEEEESDAIEISEIDSALITFLTGDAYLLSDGQELFADIGDGLYAGDELRVETGYAELQVGSIGTVRVREDSLIRLDDIVLQPGASSVDLRVVSGSILNKVERLAGSDSYDVRTETAVMGVRGTEFGVNVDPQTGTRVAVRTGRVAVVPPAADPQRIRARAEASGDAADAVEAVARRVEESALIIEADEEVDVDEETAQAAEEVIREVDTIIEEVTTAAAAGQVVDVAAVTARLDVAAQESTQQITESTARTRRTASVETRQELEEIEEIRVVALPQRRPEAVEVEPGEEAPEAVDEPPQPVLIPVRVQVQPAEAQIRLDGRNVGRGRFAGVFVPGEDLEFQIGLEGYSEETLRVTVDSQRGRTYRISLSQQAVPERAPEPVSLTVNATPSDAQVLFNGALQGTGNVSAEFNPGDEILVRVEQDGYHSAEERVVIGEQPRTVRLDLERITGNLSIQVTPDDAQIVVDGTTVGTGRFEEDYPLGTELSVRLEREGFAPITVPVTIDEGANPVRYDLSREVGVLQVSTVPAGARIIVDDGFRGTGSFEQALPTGSTVQIRVEMDGYVDEERTVEIAGTGNVPVRFTLQRQLAPLTITSVPGDARITIDGAAAGTGSAQRNVPVGSTVQVSASRPGFAPVEQSVNVATGGRRLELRLEPRPIEANVTVSQQALVRGLAYSGSLVIAADASGTVYGVDPAGRVAWRQSSANAQNENGLPVVIGNSVAFSGAAELLVLNSANGSVRTRRELSGGESHLFGRRPVAWNNQLLFPADDELIVLSSTGTPTGRTIPIPGGSKMSPVIAGGRVVLADQQGAVLIINPSNGALVATVPTNMSQPVALAAATDGSRVFMAGRRGVAVAVDVGSATVAWQTELPGGRGIFLDPVIAGDVVAFFLRDEIVALSRTDGSQRYRLPNATTAPLVVGNQLYYGATGGLLRVANADNGRLISSLRLGAAPKTSPVEIGGDRLAVGLENGRMVIVHPAGIR